MNASNPILTAAALLAAFTLTANAAEVLKPQVGEPLRDAAVTRAPDGTYYLTGTRAFIKDGKPDFLDNDGIKLWSSQDLVTWKDEGLVWDMQSKEYWNVGKMNRRPFHPPERPFGTSPGVQGVTSPRLSFLDGKPYMTYSICGHDARILNSKNEKPIGPYQICWEPLPEKEEDKQSNWHKIGIFWRSKGPGHGSLFRDADGSVYLVKGPGYLQKFKSDLSDIVGLSEFLLTKVAGFPNADWCAKQFDPHAAFLFFKGGKYYLTWAAYTDEAGFKREDSFLAVSDKLTGPYSEPVLLIPGSGPVVLFDGPDGQTMASCSIADAPVLIPLEKKGDVLATAANIPLPAAPKAAKAGKIEMFNYAAVKPSGKWVEPNEKTGRKRLVPLFDAPIADTSICRGGDGTWYMTGTAASRREGGRFDFQNNDGIHLWKSSDMNTWEYVGKVWDIEKDGSAWAKQYRIPGDNPVRDDFCRGVTSPEIHYALNTYWIAYSMNGRGTALLKSKTGKAEGPYENMGRVTGLGEAPNLFIDDLDGQAWWLWGRPLAMAHFDLAKAATQGDTVALETRLGESPPMHNYDTVDIWDPTGPFLIATTNPKTKKRRYSLSFSAITQSYGRANRETLIAGFDTLDQRSETPMLMVRHGGQNSVFAGPDGKLYASFCGADPSATFRERPGIVPLEWNLHQFDVPRAPIHEYYTRGGGRDGWEMHVPYGRDPWVSHQMADGYFYLTCSPPGGSPDHEPASWWTKEGVQLFRSKNLINWERLPCPYTYEQAKKEYRAYKEARGEAIDKANEPWFAPDGKWWSWTQIITFMRGNYWMLVNGPPTQDSFLLKSQSGKPEGPYKLHGVITLQPPADIWEEADGRVYAGHGTHGVSRFTEDLTAEDKSWKMRTTGRDKILDSGRFNAACDCGYRMYIIEGKHVWLTIQSAGDYSGTLFYADSLDGTFKPFVGWLPDLGFGRIFKDNNGQWYAVMQTCHSHHNYGTLISSADGFPGAVNGSSCIQPIELDMKSDPPRVFLKCEMGMIGRAVYEK